MNKIEFEWYERKAKSNLKKHAVTFEEAQSTFYDEQAIVYFDPDNSDEEERFILLGTSHKLKQLVVCHCFRENESKIRIISARKADKHESKSYWENQK
jgi:uncharacterized DUF497 family protein